MIEPGRLCIKIAGRDAGKKCVIVEILDDKFVTIDGETRRRKCNIMHLELLDEKIDIKKGASHSDVSAAFTKIGLKARETKPKEKTVRPRKLRRSKLATQQKTATAETKKTEKKTVKKAKKKAVKKTAKEHTDETKK